MGSGKGPNLLFVSVAAGDPSTWTCLWILADTQHTCNTASVIQCYFKNLFSWGDWAHSIWYNTPHNAIFLWLPQFRKNWNAKVFARSEVLKVVLLQTPVSWDVTPCHWLWNSWCFEGGRCFASKVTHSKILLESADEGTTLLGNIRNCMVSQSWRLASSSQSW